MPLVELDAELLEETAIRLKRRIGERFPGSELEARSGDLIQLIARLRRRSVEIAEPIWWVRLLYVVVGAVVVIGLVAVAVDIEAAAPEDLRSIGWVQFVESAANDLLLLIAGIAFVATVETRIKRRRALSELHEIRSFAHVIDMLQLTKDPQRLSRFGAQPTSSSPEVTMTAYELGRYLDYCSELLSLSAKGAAMVAQRFEDPSVLATVNEIETLTSGLSRKIWQKLLVLMTTNPEAAPTSEAASTEGPPAGTPRPAER